MAMARRAEGQCHTLAPSDPVSTARPSPCTLLVDDVEARFIASVELPSGWRGLSSHCYGRTQRS